jgi:hypothetical protein
MQKSLFPFQTEGPAKKTAVPTEKSTVFTGTCYLLDGWLHPHCCIAPAIQLSKQVFIQHPAPSRLAILRLQGTSNLQHTPHNTHLVNQLY